MDDGFDAGHEEEVEPEEKYENMNEDDVEHSNEIFDNFDKLKDQTIEIGQLGPFLRWMNFNPTQKQLKSYAEEFDPTHKGIITRKACTRIVDRRQRDPDTYEELVQALKVFDKEGTGKIAVSEMRYIMSRLGDPMDEETVDDMICELDPNDLGFISLTDYGKVCFNMKDAGKDGDGPGGKGNQDYKHGGAKKKKKKK